MEVVIGKSDNKIVHFNVKQIPHLGRTAQGVIGTRLSKPKDKVIGASFASKDQKLLSINSDGNGKLTLLSNYRITNRGAKGNLAIKGKFINRSLVASVAVDGNESLLIAKSSGKFILTELKKTRITKRLSC